MMEILTNKYFLFSVCIPFLLSSCANESPVSISAPVVDRTKSEQVKMPPPDISTAIASAWMEQHIREMESIKPGSSVAELQKLFVSEDVLFSNTRIFKYRQCPEIKIQVTIDEKNGNGRDMWSSDSQVKIQKVSLPYLSDFAGFPQRGLLN